MPKNQTESDSLDILRKINFKDGEINLSQKEKLVEPENKVYLKESKPHKIQKIWQEQKLNINLPLVDMQNLNLISKLLYIEDLTPSKPSIQLIRDEILNLLVYFSEHFSTEQELFKAFNYEGAKRHILKHKEFIDSLIVFQISDDNYLSDTLMLIRKIKDWLYNHINKEDKIFSNYILNSDKSGTKDFVINNLIKSKTFSISKKEMDLYNSIYDKFPIIFNDDVKYEDTEANILSTIKHIWYSFNLSLHIPIIDIQHIRLIMMIVQLDQTLKSNDASKKKEIFDKAILNAINYTKEHFLTEEEIMKKYYFGGIIQHVKEHKEFVDFIFKRYNEFKNGDENASLLLVRNLKQWLFYHIALKDKKFLSWLIPILPKANELVKKLHLEGKITVTNMQVNLYQKVMGTNAQI